MTTDILLGLVLVGVVVAILLARKTMATQQEILDNIAAADTKIDAQTALIGHVKTEVDALKALIANGADLSAISTAVGDLSSKVDAGTTALTDLDADAAG